MGLRWCWDYGIKSVVIETDCLEVVECLNNLPMETSEHGHIFEEIEGMLRRDWEAHVSWCRREANCLADSLAKRALEIAPGVVNFTYVPDFIAAVVEQEKLLVVQLVA